MAFTPMFFAFAGYSETDSDVTFTSDGRGNLGMGLLLGGAAAVGASGVPRLTSSTPTRCGRAAGAGLGCPLWAAAVMMAMASRVAPSLSR